MYPAMGAPYERQHRSSDHKALTKRYPPIQPVDIMLIAEPINAGSTRLATMVGISGKKAPVIDQSQHRKLKLETLTCRDTRENDKHGQGADGRAERPDAPETDHVRAHGDDQCVDGPDLVRQLSERDPADGRGDVVPRHEPGRLRGRQADRAPEERQEKGRDEQRERTDGGGNKERGVPQVAEEGPLDKLAFLGAHAFADEEARRQAEREGDQAQHAERPRRPDTLKQLSHDDGQNGPADTRGGEDDAGGEAAAADKVLRGKGRAWLCLSGAGRVIRK